MTLGLPKIPPESTRQSFLSTLNGICDCVIPGRTFSKELFVILRIYADESPTDKALSLCGFMATADYWAKFSRRWNAVLWDHRAPYFHFREFADKANRWKIEGNPYLGWNEKQRDSFLRHRQTMTDKNDQYGGTDFEHSASSPKESSL